MSAYWTTFENRSPGCVDAMSLDEAREAAAEFGVVKDVAILPYPAIPRLRVQSACPPFCYTPTECVGKTSCPKNYACSE